MTSLQVPSTSPQHGALGVVRLSNVTIVLIGLLALIGWLFNIQPLRTVFPGLMAMSATEAAAFILLGIALVRSSAARSSSRTIARGAAVAVIVIAAVAVLQNLMRGDFGGGASPAASGRAAPFYLSEPLGMSPAAAACFVMLATALLLVHHPRLWVRSIAEGLVLVTMLVSGLALLSYVYGVTLLYVVEPWVAMALHSAIAFWVAGAGVLHTRDDFRIMAPLRSSRMGGVVARTLLPAVVGVPLLSGWVVFQFEKLGYVQIEAGMAINALSMIIAFGVLVWYCANRLNQADEQQALAREKEDELRTLTRLDPLTNLLNRRRFKEQLEAEWSRAGRFERPLSCIMLDLDDFKSVNDTWGHLVGDDVLCAVAELIERECRPSDIICRYGGEEFCILLPETSEPEAAAAAERIRALMADTLIESPACALVVTASFGVTERLGPLDQIEALVHRADLALLAAKRMGRNQVAVASALADRLEVPLETVDF